LTAQIYGIGYQPQTPLSHHSFKIHPKFIFEPSRYRLICKQMWCLCSRQARQPRDPMAWTAGFWTPQLTLQNWQVSYPRASVCIHRKLGSISPLSPFFPKLLVKHQS